MKQGMRQSITAALVATTVLATGGTATLAADDSVVSLQDRQPTAEEIVRGFGGETAPQALDLPPGLMPANIGGGTVKTRGIRMDTAAAPAAQSAGQTPPAPAATAPSVDCSSGRAIAVSIEFGLDSYALRGDAYATLREVAAAMNSDALRDCAFIVEGHTDAQGEDTYNLHLSQQRAEAVRDFLAASEVEAARLRAIGKGEQELLEPAEPASARNRRVQFRIGG